MHAIAAKAVAFGEALQPEFKSYIEKVLINAKVLAEALLNEGLTVVSEGTDNHIILLDLRPIGLTVITSYSIHYTKLYEVALLIGSFHKTTVVEAVSDSIWA